MNFTNTEIFGFEAAVRGSRNPLDSWKNSDSKWVTNDCFEIGKKDLDLLQRLIRSGDSHSKFMRMIHVQVDVDMPRYFWSELDTYHFGTKNSRSTMHKLLNNNSPITLDAFVTCEEDEDLMIEIIGRLEELRQEFKKIQKDPNVENKSEKLNYLLLRAKRLLPEGFLQMRTWDTNYAELRNIYFQRKDHRLKEEWGDVFCTWVESLPYAYELITYGYTEPIKE